ncbi:MAG: UBP-type zinc finger domain-containing protein [Acidimicrobiia bacterium]
MPGSAEHRVRASVISLMWKSCWMSCEHLASAPGAIAPLSAGGCEDCLLDGSQWVHLRLCLTCGKVACCDSSPRRHASAHAFGQRHPVVRSLEPGEDWRWCYSDSTFG